MDACEDCCVQARIGRRAQQAARRCALLILTATVTSIAAAQHQPFPNKPIRLVSPYAPGGGNDILARLIAQKLSAGVGQSVIVVNRPGANTVVGTEVVARATPDGYTLLLAATPHVINPHLQPTPFDAVADFAPVATLASSENLMVANITLGANNVRELIALAKSRPGQLNFATSGSGGPAHLAGELFNMMAGVKLQHIPYKGSAPALADVIGGQIQLSIQAPSAAIPHVKSGRLKGIAISGNVRLAALPQVPTFAEDGLPGFEARIWYGVLAPAGSPKPALDRLAAEIAAALGAPEIREKLAAQGQDPFVSTPAQFAALIKADLARYGKVIKTAGIKLEN